MRKLGALLLLLPSLVFAQDPRRRSIESGLATPVSIEGVRGQELRERMHDLGVPAVSYAVVENGRIVLAAAAGEADVAHHRRATTSTLFQAASISKPVTAMGVLDLVERGRLPLDVPVNDLLRSWHLPDNALTAATPVTLRMLLSHSGGTTVHGFLGYAPNERVPTLLQLLDGKPPANSHPVVVDVPPNTKFLYSGGGISIVQAALIDRTGLPFPTFMRRTVLTPLGMTASTYEQPLPPSRRGEAATAYNAGVREVEGKWHVYPEMAAAGLWTTPSDLAKVIIEMENAVAGRATRLLSIDAARHMLTPRFPAGENASIGLGFFIEQHGGVSYLNHAGGNEGFRCLLIGTIDGSHGAVVMTNSDTGVPLLREVVSTIAREYAWPGYAGTPLAVAPLDEAEAARLAGRWELAPHDVVNVRREGGRLEVLDLKMGWQPLYPLRDGTLARSDRDLRYALTADGLTVIDDASGAAPKRRLARHLPPDAKPSAHELLAAGRIDEAKSAYREQFHADPASVPEDKLNEGGYDLVLSGRVAQGLALLELNTELYPASANTYDTLAEALMLAGRNDRARAVTEEGLRHIDADPNASAELKEMLRKLAKRRLEMLAK